MTLTHHILSRQMLIEAESHRLLMQNTHSVAAEQCGGTEAKISAEERSLRRSQCRLFSTSCSRTLHMCAIFGSSTGLQKHHVVIGRLQKANPASALLLFFFFFFTHTCKLWSFCYYRAITFSHSISHSSRHCKRLVLCASSDLVSCLGRGRLFCL